MKKISIISPCYNGESHLLPYIESLLSQTYSNVEYIFVNDGSTDKTEEIINSYRDKFKEKGWTFTYIRQDVRGGQAKAINQGLKIFTGDYLCCIDSDDIIMPSYLEEMSGFLENNKDCGIVFPWAEVIEETSNKHIQYFKRDIPPHVKDTLFDDILLHRGHNILYASFMIKSSVFFEIYPDRHIYEGLSGQNAQLILPIIYNYKCGYVKKILYKSIARKGSDSRPESVQDYVNKTYSWEDIRSHTIKIIPNMPEYEKSYYFAINKNYWEELRQRKLTPKKTKKTNKIFSVTYEYKDGIKHKYMTLLGIKFRLH